MKTRIYLFSVLIALVLTSCVQETHPKTVTFKVNADSTLVFETIGIRGNMKPLSWDKTKLMSGPDENGYYTTVVNFDTASDQASFKFVINDSLFELNDKPNRRIRFEYKPETLEYSGTFDKTTE